MAHIIGKYYVYSYLGFFPQSLPICLLFSGSAEDLALREFGAEKEKEEESRRNLEQNSGKSLYILLKTI